VRRRGVSCSSRRVVLDSSPWGRVQDQTRFDNGLVFVSTASHGGFFVPDDLLPRIGARGRAYAKRWSGSESWFEEDVAVCFVVLAFPEAFNAEARESAAAVLAVLDRGLR